MLFMLWLSTSSGRIWSLLMLLDVGADDDDDDDGTLTGYDDG